MYELLRCHLLDFSINSAFLDLYVYMYFLRHQLTCNPCYFVSGRQLVPQSYKTAVRQYCSIIMDTTGPVYVTVMQELYDGIKIKWTDHIDWLGEDTWPLLSRNYVEEDKTDRGKSILKTAQAVNCLNGEDK